MSKPKKIDIFEVLRNITEDKTDRWFEFSSIYNPYMIMAWLSTCDKTIAFAEIANQMPSLTKQQHYDYLRTALPMGKRFFKYPKKRVVDEDVAAVAEYYKVSARIAKEYLEVLTPEQQTVITKIIDRRPKPKEK